MNIAKINTVDSGEVEKKWDCIYAKSDFSVPADVLIENRYLLPKKGCALDLASGLGANALYLAEIGLNTCAWDVSSVALNKLQQSAKKKKLKLSTKKIYIEAKVLPENTFDVIVISRFLDRSLSDAIIKSLKPNGLLYYQTYVKGKRDSIGPKNPDYLLDRNELLQLFCSLNVVVYRENSVIGDMACGERNEAHYIGQK